MARILTVRLDSDGDVLLTGPAIRLLARLGRPVDLLVSSAGLAAAHLLPGVAEVLRFEAPWNGFRPPEVDPAATTELVERLRRRDYDLAVVFTSFHQSPLPMALLARLAGIPRVAATSTDYPGSLLDVRHRRADPPGGGHEVEAAVELAVAAGAPRPGPGGLSLAVRRPPAPLPPRLEDRSGYVVVHPGASVPARAPTPSHAGAIVGALVAAGREVVVTGGLGERDVVEATLAAAGEAATRVVDLCGATDLPALAAVLDRAGCVVVGNTGPAHLAAAVGTPVVSLFAPVVPSSRWVPYGVPSIVLGDQEAPCRDTRARTCPVPGHPCLSSVPLARVVDAVTALDPHPPNAACHHLAQGRPCAS